MRKKTKRIGVLATAIFLAWGNGSLIRANDFAALQDVSDEALVVTWSGQTWDKEPSRLFVLAEYNNASGSSYTHNTAYDYAMKMQTASVSSGAVGAVTGGNLYDELHLSSDGNHIMANQTTGANLAVLDTAMQTKDVTKMTASAGFTIGTSSSRDANQILNTTYTVTTDAATIEQDNTGFVTGDQIYDEIHVADSASEDGIKAANTVAANLQALDTKVKTNTDAVAINTEAINNLKNMTNLTQTGELAIKNLAHEAVSVTGDNKSITVKTEKNATTGNWTYKISAVQANIASEDSGLMTAESAYTEFRAGADGHYIRANQTVGSNLSTLDGQVKANTDGILAIENQIGNKLDAITGQMINPIAAGAAALAALQPEAYSPENKWSFAVGYGHYKNANATAMGVFFKPEAMATFSAGSTIESGDLMLHAGASFKAGRADTETKKQDAKEPMQRLQELEAAVSKQEMETGVPTARMAKWAETHAVESKRLADLEVKYKTLQADAATCMKMNHAQEKELAALAKERAFFYADMEKIKNERKKLKDRLAALLSQQEIGKGEGQ